MRVLIIGASGSIASRLSSRLQEDFSVNGKKMTELILADVKEPEPFFANDDAKQHISPVAMDITNFDNVLSLITEKKPELIFHLAAIVSGDAEANFEFGYKVNVDGFKNLLESIRHLGDSYRPRVIFSSSLAVFGPPFAGDGIITDGHAATPRGSYGTQKRICELLLEDYSRKGYVDGITIRFPTIAVRPGKPNKAASSFISGIIREPLNGVESKLPVGRSFRHPIASPNKAVEYLLHAAAMTPFLTGDRTLNVPSITVSVEEMLNVLAKVAGPDVLKLVIEQPDPFIQSIVDQWPQQFDCRRAKELGFIPDSSFEDIVRNYIIDELGGGIPSTKKAKHV